MKYILLLADGMADYPLKELGGDTPLQAAKTIWMDRLAKSSRCGRLLTIPPGMPTGSAVANLSILGYDPQVYFQGRGVLEAASMGVHLKERDVAFRCNIICVENERIKNHSAGHISTQEAAELIRALNSELGRESIQFFPGVSYRHLLVLRESFSPQLKCIPPHDVPGELISNILPRPAEEEARSTARIINELIFSSRKILEDHPVNLKRAKLGQDKANMIWPWSPGCKPKMKTFQERFGINGAVISAVDLIRGLGIYAGFEVIKVEGITGLFDTNYEGKAQACLEAIKNYDLVWVHVEAADEAAHEGNLRLKIKCIEDFDSRLVSKIIRGLDKLKEEVSVALLPDHPTPISLRTHTAEAVPFLIYHPAEKPDEVAEFDEISCQKGSLGFLKEEQFIIQFLKD